MAVSSRTLLVLDNMRVSVNETVGRHEAAILRTWATTWTELADEWQRVADDLAADAADGTWPSRAKINRAKRVRDALAATREATEQLARDLEARMDVDIPALTGKAAEWEARLTASQLPPDEADMAQVRGTYNRVDPRALDDIVKRSIANITALTSPLGAQAEAELRRALIRGVALGRNPRVVADDLVRNLNGAFNGGRNRALVITRTEMLDAHRAGAKAQDLANADTLAGWTWSATLDNRTCPSCWGMHGTLHPLDEDGPIDHQQGRCARLPQTKSWKDLGFDIEEPPSLLPNAEKTFASLSPEDQEAIMGVKRLQLLNDGTVSWGDLAQRRSTDGWRDSIVPTPTAQLARSAS